MATPKELHEMSRILMKHGKDLREDAARARERSHKLREIADGAKLSGDANHAHAQAARHRQDER
ncbi:MAG: hypothetical protein ACLPKW_04720 [Acetobacteraceae bacterium]